MDSTKKYEERIYKKDDCCVFRKTKEAYGGLSNMAPGFPLKVNGVFIASAEALYQACRFPNLPEVQRKILNEKSPMTAKMVGKPYREETRIDWDEARIKIMRWCLRIKLAQHYLEFGKLLETTLNKSIVEDSRKDAFWGTIADKENPNVLKGVNALGRLLMELRKQYNDKRFSKDLFVIEPLDIPNFNLLGKPIAKIDEREAFLSNVKKSLDYKEPIITISSTLTQQGSITHKTTIEEPQTPDVVIDLPPPVTPQKKGAKKTRQPKATAKKQTTLPF